MEHFQVPRTNCVEGLLQGTVWNINSGAVGSVGIWFNSGVYRKWLGGGSRFHPVGRHDGLVRHLHLRNGEGVVKMLELKVKDLQALEDVVSVFNTNGYKVRTYVQWVDKAGGEISHFTIEVPGMAPDVQWLPRVYKRIQQAIESLGRNSHD